VPGGGAVHGIKSCRDVCATARPLRAIRVILLLSKSFDCHQSYWGWLGREMQEA